MYVLASSSPQALLNKSAYDPGRFVLRRSRAWAFFVAHRSRDYFLKTVCRKMPPSEQVLVAHTVETEVLLSTVLSSTLPSARRQELLEPLRCAVADCTREHYRMSYSLWQEVVEMVAPYLQAHILENVELQVRLFDGSSWLAKAREKHPHEPLVFFLKFRMDYVSFTESNGGLCDHQWIPEPPSSPSSFPSPASFPTVHTNGYFHPPPVVPSLAAHV